MVVYDGCVMQIIANEYVVGGRLCGVGEVGVIADGCVLDGLW